MSAASCGRGKWGTENGSKTEVPYVAPQLDQERGIERLDVTHAALTGS